MKALSKMDFFQEFSMYIYNEERNAHIQKK